MTAEGQIKSFFQRWETLEAEKQQVADLMKDLFAEAKGFGYDTKALRAAFRLKAKQDLDSLADAEFEAIVDTYMSALNAPTVQARDARMRARENIEEFDPITGEFITKSPRKAAEAVPERAATQGAAIASDLVEAVKAEAVAGGSGQPEVIPALTGQLPGVDVDGAESAGVTGGESAAGSEGSRQSALASELAGRGNASDKESVTVVGTESGTVSNYRSDGGLNIVHKHTEIATASQGEAEAPADGSSIEIEEAASETSVDRVTPDDMGSAAANTGGDHEVTGSAPRAGQQDRASNNGEDAILPNNLRVLRPHCQEPKMCRSGTRDHCWNCKKLMREGDAA